MSATDELITWFRACLDEDEQAIQHAEFIGEQSTIPWLQLRDDIDAKRRVLDEYQREDLGLTPDYYGALELVIGNLASAYDDRDGYRQEWRP